MGAVRAGVWGRSVCINENFDLGSMIPQVYWALLKKILVIIMNPNENYYKNEIIPLNESMESHAKFVWRNYILNSGFSKLLVIAHSAGGGCL